VYVATWHGVKRAGKAGGDAADLDVEPMGGVVPTAIAVDADAVYFAVRAPCRDDLARATECGEIAR
jgi:hypothetical protein